MAEPFKFQVLLFHIQNPGYTDGGPRAKELSGTLGSKIEFDSKIITQQLKHYYKIGQGNTSQIKPKTLKMVSKVNEE